MTAFCATCTIVPARDRRRLRRRTDDGAGVLLFWDRKDKADYCVLTANYVREIVRCRIADDRVAFFGVLIMATNEF